MPDSSRIWLYQASRPLLEVEQRAATDALRAFSADWKAHGAALRASSELVLDRVMLLAVDEREAMASGCSIDESVRLIRALEERLSVPFFERLELLCQTEQGWVSIHRDALAEAVSEGRLHPDTPVVDLTVADLGQWRQAGITALEKTWAAIPAGVAN